jgi:ABC-type polysaccharide/polyol phosphate export permease
MITFSYGLSAMTKDAVFASEISTVLTLPNFLASGYTWPDIAFPKALLLLKYGMPMATVAFMMRKITLMGGTLADCGNQLWALTGWTIVAVVLAWSGTRRILAHNTPGGN